MPDASLNLRRADTNDMKIIYEWRNDPWLVPFSTSQNTIEWHEHQKWFSGALDNQDILMLIIEVDGKPAGQVRFNRANQDECDVAIYMTQSFTGKGYGAKLLMNACEVIKEAWAVSAVYGYIREDNVASIKAFKKSSFVEVNTPLDIPPKHVCYKKGL